MSKNPVPALWLCLCLFFSLPIFSAPEQLSQVQSKQSLSDYTLYQLDTLEPIPQSPTALKTFLSLYGLQVQQFDRSGGRFIHVAETFNDTQIRQWAIQVDGRKLKDIKYHIIADFDYQTMQAGYYHFNGFPVKKGFTFYSEPMATQWVVIEYNNTYYPKGDRYIHFMPQQEYAEISSSHIISLAFMFGMLAILLIYSGVQAYQNSNKVLMFYSLYIVWFSIGFAIHFGILQQLTSFDLYRFHTFPFMVSIFFNTLFTVRFLDLNASYRWPRKLLLINGILTLFVAFSSLVEYVYSAKLLHITALIWASLAMYSGIRRYRDGFRPALNFCFAFIWVVLPLFIILVLRDYLGVSVNRAYDSDLLVFMGATLEALFLALAIIHYQKLSSDDDLRFRQALERNVTERTENLHQAQIEQARLIEELKHADDAKTHFLANMSHEIRTPLTSIIGYSDTLKDNTISGQQRDKAINVISHSSQHLLEVINDILDLSKIESGMSDIEISDVNVMALIQQVLDIGQPKANAKRLEFLHQYNFPLPSVVQTDGTKLKQILINLVSNAIKFTNQGSVSVTMKMREEKLQFIVTDTGIGMTEEQLTHVFTPFAQGDQSIKRRFGGTGLGLSICKSFSEQLSGELVAQSTPMTGTSFTLTIPMQLGRNNRWIQAEAELSTDSYQGNYAAVNDGDYGFNVLLVDDHVHNREYVALLLSKLNLKVEEANDGRQAIELAKKRAYDLILMDIQMPEVDGITAFQQIRSFDQETPVIALTANNMQHEIDEYHALGFSGYLAKPIQIQALSRMINQFKRSDELSRSKTSAKVTP